MFVRISNKRTIIAKATYPSPIKKPDNLIVRFFWFLSSYFIYLINKIKINEKDKRHIN